MLSVKVMMAKERVDPNFLLHCLQLIKALKQVFERIIFGSCPSLAWCEILHVGQLRFGALSGARPQKLLCT